MKILSERQRHSTDCQTIPERKSFAFICTSIEKHKGAANNSGRKQRPPAKLSLTSKCFFFPFCCPRPLWSGPSLWGRGTAPLCASF
ncbi:hypothetical protein CDAR_617861 [Caerostris darwini]|uniref:Uncharacterized protein n=1 Tax=Caerostris darwini TaxID=1538125 RepID=A0AAV4RT69_9ARAC|nr:hypothetical protein CDAR_617861 [Caerostris darwini]